MKERVNPLFLPYILCPEMSAFYFCCIYLSSLQTIFFSQKQFICDALICRKNHPKCVVTEPISIARVDNFLKVNFEIFDNKAK